MPKLHLSEKTGSVGIAKVRFHCAACMQALKISMGRFPRGVPIEYVLATPPATMECIDKNNELIGWVVLDPLTGTVKKHRAKQITWWEL